MRIIVGLGNPGEKYQNTRHNIGWLALDAWLKEASWHHDKRFNALVYEMSDALFIKPLSYMNDSGQVVQKVMSYYQLLPKKLGLLKKRDADLNSVLTVIHDELDIDFGKWRLASDSSSAGHRGVQSIINYLKTQKFSRIRLGIKNDLLRTHIPAEKFVLQPFSSAEKDQLATVFSSINLEQLF